MKPKIKVLMAFYSPIIKPGGKSERLQGYLKKFDQTNEFEVHFVGLPDEKDLALKSYRALKSYTDSKIALQIEKIFSRVGNYIGLNGLGRYLAINILSYKGARENTFHNVDIVFAHPGFRSLIKKAKSLSIPVVIEASDSHPQYLLDIDKKRRSFYGQKSNRFIMRKAVKRNIDSYRLADKIIVFGTHAQQTFIENGIQNEKLQILYPPLEKKMQPYSFVSKNPDFTCVATHTIRKGTDLVLYAWEEYKNNGGSGELNVIGKPCNDFWHIYKKLSCKDSISLLGHVDTVDYFKQKFTVLMFPSYAEGRPRLILEAVGAGCCCVVSREATADIIVHGYNGYIVKKTSSSITYTMHTIDSEWMNEVMQLSNNAKRTTEKTNYYMEVTQILNGIIEKRFLKEKMVTN